MKILFRGGSVTAGHGVEKDFSFYVKRSLKDKNVELIIKARFKENSFNGVWTYDDDIAPFSPDILVLQFGIDDAYWPVYRSEFKENLVRIVRRAEKETNSRVVLSSLQPFDDIYDMQMIYIYYRVIREVAVDLDCVHWPVHTYISGYCHENQIPVNELVQRDTRYLNEKGHRVLGDYISNKIVKMIENY